MPTLSARGVVVRLSGDTFIEHRLICTTFKRACFLVKIHFQLKIKKEKGDCMVLNKTAGLVNQFQILIPFLCLLKLKTIEILHIFIPKILRVL